MKSLSVILTVAALLSTSAYSQETAKQDSPEVQHLLTKLSNDDDAVRYEALQSLSKFGRGVIPTVTDKTKNGTGYGRVYMARVLLSIEPDNELALTTLAEMARTKQERKDVRRYASYVLALSAKGINILAGMLKDNDVFVRRSAAFALEELMENGLFLPATLKERLIKSLPLLASALADDDKIVSGVSAEAFWQIQDEDVPVLEEVARSSNAKSREVALAVLEKRNSGYKPESVVADAKPGFEEFTDRRADFLHGNLGVIRALRMGGEPVRDDRSIPDAKSPRSLHIVLKSSTRKLSTRMNQFNPYEDLR